jgi:hypothetical protein
MEKMMSKTHAVTAKSEVPGVRGELSAAELEAVSGGEIAVTFLGHKVTAGDVAHAAKWVWHKFF